MYRRPQLRHRPGLAGAPCFYETHQVLLTLAYGGWICARMVFSVLRIDDKKHGVGIANQVTRPSPLPNTFVIKKNGGGVLP